MRRKTKIVATLGRPDRKGLHDRQGGTLREQLDHETMLRWLVDAGANVFRFNMSFAGKSNPYGANEAAYLHCLNKNKNDFAREVAVLGDLPGPKVRLELLSGSESVPEVDLKEGDRFYLDFRGYSRIPSDSFGANVYVNAKAFHDEVRRIENVSDINSYVDARHEARHEVTFPLGDGKVRLRAIPAPGDQVGLIICEVSEAGVVKDGQGLTVKEASLRVKAFQEPDQRALDFLLEHAGGLLAFVAVSFVQTEDEILLVKNHIEAWLRDNGQGEMTPPGVIAKIETRDAWNNIDRILDVADGIMVARGDLGEQVPSEEIPTIQKNLIQKSLIRGKPVITATQMLDSMEERLEPTRAEVTDVFNAILDGSDAVMLSGETSSGYYPIQAVQMMGKIAEQAERYLFQGSNRSTFEDVIRKSELMVDKTTERLRAAVDEAAREADSQGPVSVVEWFIWKRALYEAKLARSRKQPTTDRISRAACDFSEGGDYKAIIAPTTSGRTAFMMSRFRPRVPIIGAAHDWRTYRKLIFSAGVYPVFIGSGWHNVEEVLNAAIGAAQEINVVKRGDEVVATSGNQLYETGTTNMVQIRRVE